MAIDKVDKLYRPIYSATSLYPIKDENGVQRSIIKNISGGGGSDIVVLAFPLSGNINSNESASGIATNFSEINVKNSSGTIITEKDPLQIFVAVTSLYPSYENIQNLAASDFVKSTSSTIANKINNNKSGWLIFAVYNSNSLMSEVSVNSGASVTYSGEVLLILNESSVKSGNIYFGSTPLSDYAFLGDGEAAGDQIFLSTEGNVRAGITNIYTANYGTKDEKRIFGGYSESVFATTAAAYGGELCINGGIDTEGNYDTIDNIYIGGTAATNKLILVQKEKMILPRLQYLLLGGDSFSTSSFSEIFNNPEQSVLMLIQGGGGGGGKSGGVWEGEAYYRGGGGGSGALTIAAFSSIDPSGRMTAGGSGVGSTGNGGTHGGVSLVYDSRTSSYLIANGGYCGADEAGGGGGDGGSRGIAAPEPSTGSNYRKFYLSLAGKDGGDGSSEAAITQTGLNTTSSFYSEFSSKVFANFLFEHGTSIFGRFLTISSPIIGDATKDSTSSSVFGAGAPSRWSNHKKYGWGGDGGGYTNITNNFDSKLNGRNGGPGFVAIMY